MAKTTRIPRKIFDKMKKAGIPVNEFEPSDLPMEPLTALMVDVLGVHKMLDSMVDEESKKKRESFFAGVFNKKTTDEGPKPTHGDGVDYEDRVERDDVGLPVWFSPPQECRTNTTPLFYAATITQVNPDLSVELVTFGPNSLYFQHKVQQSKTIKPGYWCLPYDLEESN